MMKNQLLLVILFAIGLTSCEKQHSQKEDLDFQWTLVEYANVLGSANCQYDEGDIVWSFDDNKVKIDGILVTPWAFVPCYIVDAGYSEELTFTIDESETENVIYIEDLDLKAKITIDEELVLEIISTTKFRPSTEGVKLFFKKM